MSAIPSTSKKRPHPNDDDEEDEEMVWSDDEGTCIEGIRIPPPAKPINLDHKNTRLMITKINNNFFKSYASNTVLGPFSKCFNAIVGPNGSGKSNVIDSMLFVFGYRATKIRSKKTSVLIHNSEQYRDVPSCTVEVYFCEIVDHPGKSYEVIPGSEFVVSRTANKDNSSYYQLNGVRVQFKEVAQLLRKHGIDLDHNRFLILQGEVEEIAMMKCKGANENETGMLEYLEDIIGTTRYKKPLLQLNDKIQNLSDLRLEKLNRLKLIEKQLEELREPMEEAIGFLKMENKVATCKNFLYQKYIYDLEEKINVTNEKKSSIEESRNELMNKMKTIAANKQEKEKELEQETGKYENIRQKKEKLKQAFDNADKRDVQLQAEMTQTNKNRKSFKDQLEQEKRVLAKLERIPEQNNKTIEECETKENQLMIEKEKIEAEKTKLLANIREETKDLQVEKEKLEIKLSELKKVANETSAAYELSESELKLTLHNEEQEKNKLKELQESIENIEINIKQRSEEIKQLKNKIPLTEKSLNEAKNEFNACKQEEIQINNDIRQKRISLEETRSSMNMAKSRGKILDSLMQQKREGNCNGLYGRLGDLGAIDQKYDVAISTACGPLDNIVVDDVSTAQWCIEFLKKHGIGRATFIALDQQVHLRQLANSKIKTPENVHRLYDLIQIQDDRVKTAFYFALRDTLVANDLEQATRIAYGAQRYRVVTLKGDLIETSGTMSGGGKKVSRGRMGQSVLVSNINPQEIERMESNLKEIEERLITIRQKENKLEGQITTLQPELSQMKLNFEKFTRELQSLQEQKPMLKQQLSKQSAIAQSTKADPKQVKKLTEIVNAKKIEFEKASKAVEEIQVDVDKLTNEIKEKTVGKMQSIDKKINNIVHSIDKCRTEITRLRVAISTSERNVKKSQQKIITLEQNIADAENKLREMKSERDTIEEDGAKLLKCIGEFTEQLEGAEEEYRALKSEVSALSKEENKLKLQQVDVDQTFKAINEKLNEFNSSIHQWHAKLSHLKLNEIPEESVTLPQLTHEELKSKNIEGIELELQTAQNSIKTTKPNLNVIQEYRAAQQVFVQRSGELDEVTKKRNSIKEWHDKVKNQRKDEFMAGFNIIKLKLKEMYQMITLGGDADFEIVSSFDPFSEGIQFNVRPPKKSWKSISNLSGGEKTLSSLALVFALHYYKPSPLYVMDEIDAALDFKNVSIVGNYIKERTKNAQFIIISLRSNMFELCDNLIGIYKVFNCTRTITIDPNELANNDKTRDKENDKSAENQRNVNA